MQEKEVPTRTRLLPNAWVLVGGVLLGACAGTSRHGTPGRYSFDSASNACRVNPAQCAAMMGREAALKPVQTLATGGATVHAVVRVLEPETQTRVEEALKDCADLARSDVLLRYEGTFKGMSPTKEECNAGVKNKEGKEVTWAMRLGEEMHTAALQCAQERLSAVRPGGFSLEPCYRYDSHAKQTTFIRPEKEKELLANGCFNELLGTFRPDVVIHPGNPLHAQAAYDFKFPCVNTTSAPLWRIYTKGPHQGTSQGTLYEEALGPSPLPIVPRWGVMQ
jgi:hypothetical protein